MIRISKSEIIYTAEKFTRMLFYLLAIILVYQIIRSLFGGTWEIEDLILGLVILNLTITFTLLSLFYDVKGKIEGHIKWHEGFDKRKDKGKQKH